MSRRLSSLTWDRHPCLSERRDGEAGQAALEYALIYAGVLLPLTFGLVFMAELLWVWHSVVELTRAGANYAATHCWQGDSENVVAHMRSHMPVMIDADQFQNGPAEIVVQYFSREPESGALIEFTCEDTECSTACVPDVVRVGVRNYEFRRFMGFLGLPPVPIPDFQASVPIESAGCSAEQEGGACLP